jgi:hypothetical protein
MTSVTAGMEASAEARRRPTRATVMARGGGAALLLLLLLLQGSRAEAFAPLFVPKALSREEKEAGGEFGGEALSAALVMAASVACTRLNSMEEVALEAVVVVEDSSGAAPPPAASLRGKELAVRGLASTLDRAAKAESMADSGRGATVPLEAEREEGGGEEEEEEEGEEEEEEVGGGRVRMHTDCMSASVALRALKPVEEGDTEESTAAALSSVELVLSSTRGHPGHPPPPTPCACARAARAPTALESVSSTLPFAASREAVVEAVVEAEAAAAEAAVEAVASAPARRSPAAAATATA